MYQMEVGIGIDIGSQSVRVSAFEFNSGKYLYSYIRSINYYSGAHITQRSKEILEHVYSGIDEMLERYSVKSVGVAATCSQVVHNGVDDDIIFWMDSTGDPEVNTVLPQVLKDHYGGAVIPEMGIAKLPVLLKQGNYHLCDLHEHISHCISVKYKWRRYQFPSEAAVPVDGQLRGTPVAILSLLTEEHDKVVIGHQTETFESETVVGESVIDCYAGLFGSGCAENELVMMAGTSTCYLFVSQMQQTIPGMWGPYSFEGELNIYQGGLSTAGILFEKLFKDIPDPFTSVEKEIDIYQESHGCIHYSLKHCHYYGELNGNRTPYCNPDMRGMIIGETLDGLSLIERYILTLEFLAFNVRHTIETINSVGCEEIGRIKIAGSQAKNDRLVSLIATVTGCQISRTTSDHELITSKGSFLLGKSFSTGAKLTDVMTSQWEDTTFPTKELQLLMDKKYKVYRDMAETQLKYRQWME